MPSVDSDDRILGGLYGLLVGDAVGVPYEFRRPASLPALDEIDIVPPAGFTRTHPSAPQGAWSDDGAQALCLLASLLHSGGLDLEDFGSRLVDWWTNGYLAVDGVVFDIGNQTTTALLAIQNGTPAERAGPSRESENGNGSLMRVLPLALWHSGTDQELIRDAARQSVVTHAHPRSQVCCALYSLWAREIIRDSEDPWNEATQKMRVHSEGISEWKTELEEHIQPEREPRGTGTGYVVDCLHSARLALQEPTFERVIQRAVSIGNDTDTTAAVAGGIAGLRHGYDAIPQRWIKGLRDRALVDPLANQLLASLRERTASTSSVRDEG